MKTSHSFSKFKPALASVLLLTGTPAQTHASQMTVEEALPYFLPGIAIDSPNKVGSHTVTGEYIVKFKPDINTLTTVKPALAYFPSLNATLLHKNTIIETSSVEYIEPNYLMQIETTPNDVEFTKQWGLKKIEAEKAWDMIHAANREVVIAVLDTGIDYTHPDLIANLWTNLGEIPNDGIDNDGNGYIDDFYGYDFVNKDSDPSDDHFHGTHCAGTIAAIGNNSLGVVGVNWSAQLMALKVADGQGTIESAKVIAAIDYAFQKGVKIISVSWGGSDRSQAIYDKIAQATGILFIASAGNNINTNTDVSPHYISSYDLDNIISVTATDQNDALAWFSNYGATSVDLGAPGTEIYSTAPTTKGLYLSLDGTSMAVPYVAGVAALVWSANPTLTVSQVKEKILQSVDLLPSLAGKTVSGGRLNAYKAVHAAPPLPVAMCKTSVNGCQVTLDGTASYDPRGDSIAGYNWTISKISTNVESNFGTSITFTAQEPGTYTASLTVKNGAGLTGQKLCDSIIVNDCPPLPRKCTWTIYKYIQDFGGNWWQLENAMEGCQADRTFEIAGVYRADLTAQGTPNSLAMVNSLDVVENPIVFPTQGPRPLPVHFDASRFTGPWQTQIIVSENQLPSLGDGVPIVTTKFKGGISVNQNEYLAKAAMTMADKANVVGQIQVTPTHIGQVADIFVYAETTLPVVGSPLYFMVAKGLQISLWDQNPATLLAFQPQVTLNAVQPVVMYDSYFMSPGTLHVFFGYRLADGTLVRNSQPIDITID